jgi:hypothetical protein
LVEPGLAEALWTTWHNDTARFFVPAFLGWDGASLLLDWKFEGNILAAQGWGVLDKGGALFANDPDDINRSAHATLAVHQHEEAFFEGIESIAQTLCGQAKDVDVLQVHLAPTEATVRVRFVFHIGGKKLFRTVRNAQDIEKIAAFLQQDAHA